LNTAALFRDATGRRRDAIPDDVPAAAAPAAPAIRFGKVSKILRADAKRPHGDVIAVRRANRASGG